MSFVLEALKKQEAAQDPEAAVSLARQQADRGRHRLWIGLFAVAMVVNVAVLAWMFGPWQPPARLAPAPAPAAPAAGPERSVTEQPPAGIVAAPPPGRDAGPARADAEAARPAAEPVAAAPGPAAEAAPVRRTPPPRTVALSSLPADARTRFPGIAFSTHIYSEDPDLRAIVANGQRLVEGDRIRGLAILAITETGVTLAFENYRVEVPIATDW